MKLTFLRARPPLSAIALAVTILSAHSVPAQTTKSFRPPAAPLVTHSPYFSVWTMNDTTTGDWSKHWTGAVNAMCGLVRVDGKTYRSMSPQPDTVPALKQTGVEVTPTRTTYRLEGAGIDLKLAFLSPLLPNDLDLLARPVTYVTWEVRSVDGRPHAVSIYADVTGEWAVNTPDQVIDWKHSTEGAFTIGRCGTTQQAVLAKAGDNRRIDWGYLYVAVPNGGVASDASSGPGKSASVIADDKTARSAFSVNGVLPAEDDKNLPRAARDNWPVYAVTFDLGSVSAKPVSRHLLLAYDEIYAIELMGKRLRPYWRRDGMEPAGLLQAAEKDYARVTSRCRKFDEALMADLTRAGGAKYAQLCALAYRQCMAANGLAADDNGRPLQFPKENFSNGCISTVDVLYPSAPFFLLLSPTLLKAQLTPVLDYAASPRWRFPFAPHDLGTYPLADGQVYGGGERDERDQMPVEESGNMLLMLAAMAKIDGKADYAAKYWTQLEQWAKYLRDKGLDPENQLCTDDFAGHLAHNANLSLKAIEGLGGYALLCDMTGRKEQGAQVRSEAREMARKWVEMAKDGDHYRLTFDRPGTWSQKYNLVWDRILNLNLFPADIASTEIAYYKTKQNPFGLPLDSRKTYTKLDWTVWTATLADNKADFEALVDPLYRFANESPSHVPLTDWFETTNARQTGFQARSVVGGIFIKMLADPATWRKWARQ